MGDKREQLLPGFGETRRFFLLLLYLFIFPIFFMEGSSCTGGASHTGPTAIEMVALAPAVDVQGLGSGNAAGPTERPPSTVGLDPGCETGAKPHGICEGSSLPPPFRPCPLGGAVIVDQAAGIWWCGCPEGTGEIFDEETKKLVGCLCPSGRSLLVIVDTGRSGVCPVVAERREGQENGDQEEPAVFTGNVAVAEALLPPSGPPCNPPRAGCYSIDYTPNENMRPKPTCYCPEAAEALFRRRMAIENSTVIIDALQIDSSSLQAPLFSR